MVLERCQLDIAQGLFDLMQSKQMPKPIANGEHDASSVRDEVIDVRQLTITFLLDFAEHAEAHDVFASRVKSEGSAITPKSAKATRALQGHVEKLAKSFAKVRTSLDKTVIEVVEKKLAEGSLSVETARDAVLDQKIGTLADSLGPLEKIAPGAPEQQCWHVALAPTATFLQIKKQMECTIAQVTKPKELTSAILVTAKVGQAKLFNDLLCSARSLLLWVY
jgi:hypothetical protein